MLHKPLLMKTRCQTESGWGGEGHRTHTLLSVWKSNWPADLLFSFLLFKSWGFLSVSVLVKLNRKLKWDVRRYVGARASEMPHWLVSFQSALSDLTPSYPSAHGEITLLLHIFQYDKESFTQSIKMWVIISVKTA